MEFLWLGNPECHNPERVGGKAASLSRLAAGFPVPPGFCIPADEPADPASWLPALQQACQELDRRCGGQDVPLAVRSSGMDEDGLAASFAGQHESYLNIRGAQAVFEAVQKCLASANHPRALAYRQAHGIFTPPRIAVLVQALIPADSSAVVFSADPCSGRMDRVLINAAWGLGESLVSGSLTPDLYVVDKQHLGLLEARIGDKAVMTLPCPGGTRLVPVPRALREEPALNAGQIASLALLAIRLEQLHTWPVDLECAFHAGRLWLLQCRPITTLQSLPACAQPMAARGADTGSLPGH